jgi:hypothetical protein
MGETTMTEEKDKMIEAVARLIKKTQTGEIIWKSDTPGGSITVSKETKLGAIFTAIYQNRYLRIYKITYKMPRTDPIYRLAPISGSAIFDVYGRTSGSSDEDVWISQVNLEIVDGHKNAIWTYPTVSGLDDLYAAVQYQVADVKNFIDDLLKDE